MPEGTLSITVDATPEAAFALVADLERAPEWVPDLLSVTKLSGGPVGVGTRYAEVVQMGGKQGDGELEVTEYERPRVFAHKGQGGPAHFTGRYVLEPEGGGTRITHHYTVKLGGFMSLMAPMISGWVRRNTEAGLQNLERLLADDAGAGPAPR